MTTQKTLVLGHLARGYELSQPEASTKYRIGRLAARIQDLRDDGHKIKTVMRETASGSRIAFYSLEHGRDGL